jgi:hypothetical protein
MTKAIGIGLFVAIVSVGGTLYAGDEVDCSRLDTYADGHTYNKGDLVYWKNGAAAGAETAARTFIAVRHPRRAAGKSSPSAESARRSRRQRG